MPETREGSNEWHCRARVAILTPGGFSVSYIYRLQEVHRVVLYMYSYNVYV